MDIFKWEDLDNELVSADNTLPFSQQAGTFDHQLFKTTEFASLDQPHQFTNLVNFTSDFSYDHSSLPLVFSFVDGG